MKRRGFLAALVALVAAPWLPKPKPVSLPWNIGPLDLKEVYGADGTGRFWILEADGTYTVYPSRKTVIRSLR